MGLHAGDCILLIIAILLPPLAVLLKVGCNIQFCISLCLTILCWIPGKFTCINTNL